MSETTFKAYSRDDEMYCFDSIGELFDDMESDGVLEVGAGYYEADCRKLNPGDFVRPGRIDFILEDFDSDLYEQIGEIADGDFSGVTDEAKGELVGLIAGWIEKHVNVGRYWKIVGKTRQMEVVPDDLKEGDAA